MSTQCTVCNHPELKEIEKLIVEGKPNTVIANKFDLNHQAIRRHGNRHLPRRLVLAQKRKEQSHNETILDHLDGIVKDTKNILDEALADGHKSLALKAIRESRNNMELLSKIAVKQREYDQEDQKREDRRVEGQLSEGMESLTDAELKTLVFLQAKVAQGDANYVPDATSRIVIEHVNSGRSDMPSTDTDITEDAPSPTNTSNNKDLDDESPLTEDNQGNENKSSSKRRRNRSGQAKSSQMTRPTEEGLTDNDTEDEMMLDDLDDLDLDNLDLSEDSEIPSEETDPNWRKEERRNKLF